MNKISTVTLKNFKFFYGEIELDFERKSILMYGENGSGKSSIYWALYTFLQSVFKTEVSVSNYFNPKSETNLINRYADDSSVSSIVVEFKDEKKATSRREISKDTVNTINDQLTLEAALGSDFIDHKVLSRVYNFAHGDEVDLFGLFENQFLTFINFTEDLVLRGQTTGSKNAESWWKYIKTGLNPHPTYMSDPSYTDFQKVIDRFNKLFKYYIDGIVETTNENLEKFEQQFRIKISYRNSTYNALNNHNKGRNRKTIAPQIILTVELESSKISASKKKIFNPQSFLNEAKLSILALSLRLAILSERFVQEYPKILVLDDLLMSMDMSNRAFILDVLFKSYLKDYQILFLTHQRGLFEDTRIHIESYHSGEARKSGITDENKLKDEWEKHWKIFEIYETENRLNIPIPQIQIYETSIQKALYYFKDHIDYNACGNNLRSVLEGFFLNFIPSNYRKGATMLDGFLKEGRIYFEFVGFETSIIDKLESHLKRALNKASHYNPKSNFFKKELQEIFHLIDELKNLKNKAVLKVDDFLKFSLVTASGKTFIYTVQLLDSICLYKKADNTPSYFCDNDKRSYALINVSENGVETKFTGKIRTSSLSELYKITAEKLKETLNEDAILETDMYNVFTDNNGTTLEKLKSY